MDPDPTLRPGMILNDLQKNRYDPQENWIRPSRKSQINTLKRCGSGSELMFTGSDPGKKTKYGYNPQENRIWSSRKSQIKALKRCGSGSKPQIRVDTAGSDNWKKTGSATREEKKLDLDLNSSLMDPNRSNVIKSHLKTPTALIQGLGREGGGYCRKVSKLTKSL